MRDPLKELLADRDTFKARAIAAEAKLKQCQGVREADQVWARRFRDTAEAAEAEVARLQWLVAQHHVVREMIAGDACPVCARAARAPRAQPSEEAHAYR